MDEGVRGFQETARNSNRAKIQVSTIGAVFNSNKALVFFTLTIVDYKEGITILITTDCSGFCLIL